MKLLKKAIIPLVLSFFIFNVLSAQRPGGGEGRNGNWKERVEKQTQRMIESLDLSEAQGNKIKEANLEFAQKTRKIRMEARASEDWESMRTEMKQVRAEHQAEIAKYLTAEQLEKWEKIQEERKEKGPRKGRKNFDKS